MMPSGHVDWTSQTSPWSFLDCNVPKISKDFVSRLLVTKILYDKVFLYRKVELIFTAHCIFQSIQMYRIVRVFWKVLRAEVFLEDRHAQNLYVIGQMFKLFGTLKVLSRSYLPGSVQSP